MKKFFALFLTLLMLAAPALALASGFGGNLSIDTGHVYPDMEKSFSEGYVPTIEDGVAHIVLPLVGRTYGSTIRVEPEFPEDGPFVPGNYLFDVKEQTYSVNNTAGKKESVKAYLVKLDLPMREAYFNGTYTVTFGISYNASYGVPGEQSFSIRVPVESGQDRSGEGGTAPVLIFESGAADPTDAQGDEDVKLTVRIKNIGTHDAKNVRISAAPQSESILLTSDLNGVFIEQIPAGGEMEASFDLHVTKHATEGEQIIGVTAEYSDGAGGSFTCDAAYRVNVVQVVRIVCDDLNFPETVTSGDALTLLVNVYNPSCAYAYNASAKLDMNGMLSTTLYLGDIGPGESVQKELTVLATTLSGPSKYGQTSGGLEVRYEDKNGYEGRINQNVTSELIEPLKLTDEEKLRQEQEQKEQQTLSQWWISLLVAIALIVILVASILITRFARLMKMK